MKSWFTREDAVQYMALNNTQQKKLREANKIKLTPHPSRPSIKTGYTPAAFMKLANAAGWAIVQFKNSTAFVKRDRVFDEILFPFMNSVDCDIIKVPRKKV